MKTKIITLLFLICFYSGITAQTNNELAKQKYLAAQEAYKNKKYLDAANYLIDARRILGQTNIKIQPLLIKSLVKYSNWSRAKRNIHDYYALNPDINLVEYAEIVEIEKEVDRNLKNEAWDFKDLTESPTLLKCNNYIKNYPYEIHIDEVKKIKLIAEDDNAWKIAKNDNSYNAYYTYMDKYPLGKYYTDAQNIINNSDERDYQKAINEKSIQAYQNYLYNVPRGKYRDKITLLLSDKKDEEAYTKAFNSSSIDELENYIRTYPNGKYVTSANLLIQEIIISRGDEHYKNGGYYSAKDDYKLYVSKFPNGSKNTYSEKQIALCDRLIARDERRAASKEFFRAIAPYAVGAGTFVAAMWFFSFLQGE